MAARGNVLPVLAGRERAQARGCINEHVKQTRGGPGVPSLPEMRLELESLLLWCESLHHHRPNGPAEANSQQADTRD